MRLRSTLIRENKQTLTCEIQRAISGSKDSAGDAAAHATLERVRAFRSMHARRGGRRKKKCTRPSGVTSAAADLFTKGFCRKT